MTRRCFIVANALPPHFGWQLRADSLRAEQLAHQAGHVFEEVRYLLFLERLNLFRTERDPAVLARVPSDTTVIPLGTFEAFSERIAPAAFVFTGPDYAGSAAVAARRHTVIYDITQQDFDDPAVPDAQRARLERGHEALLGVAARRFVRSSSTGASNAVVNPLALPTTQPTHKAALVLGASHAPADPLPGLRASTDFLRASPEQAIIVAERPDPFETHASEYGALATRQNTTALLALSNANWRDVLSAAFGYADLSHPDPASHPASAFQATHAVASGVPILCGAHSEPAMSPLLDPFPGAIVNGPLDADALSAFVAKSRDGGYHEALAKAQSNMEVVRADGSMFAGLN